MSEKDRARLVYQAELEYRAARLEAGLMDDQFEVKTLDEEAKAAEAVSLQSLLSSIPPLDQPGDIETMKSKADRVMGKKV